MTAMAGPQIPRLHDRIQVVRTAPSLGLNGQQGVVSVAFNPERQRIGVTLDNGQKLNFALEQLEIFTAPVSGTPSPSQPGASAGLPLGASEPNAFEGRVPDLPAISTVAPAILTETTRGIYPFPVVYSFSPS